MGKYYKDYVTSWGGSGDQKEEEEENPWVGTGPNGLYLRPSDLMARDLVNVGTLWSVQPDLKNKFL